jgi:hypothetical protein
MRRPGAIFHFLACLLTVFAAVAFTNRLFGEDDSPRSVADGVDRIISEALKAEKVETTALVSDEEFLRRVSLDLTGTVPSPDELTLFTLDPGPSKRSSRISSLLASEDYPETWGRYWRDVIAYRSQDQRFGIVREQLRRWIRDQLREDRGWDKIAVDLLTATGDINTNGQTGLVLAQMGEANELAAETSRLFLGIQLQCAQCHDHPYDRWKREEFHQLAAFFPRLRIRRKEGTEGGQRQFEIVATDSSARSFQRQQAAQGNFSKRYGDPSTWVERYDRNSDGTVSMREVPKALSGLFGRFLRAGDKDKDRHLSAGEIKAVASMAMSRPRNRGSGEHYMPNLENPQSRGTLIHPEFFVTRKSPGERIDDADRRQALGGFLTGKDNPWFARALVNRVWKELLGKGFVEPIDDMGPDRSPDYPEALDLLAEGCRQNGYSLKWLLSAITLTETYQRKIREPSPSPEAPSFAAVTCSRMSAGKLYRTIVRVLELRPDRFPGSSSRGRGPRNSLESNFERIFGFDPSTPTEDVAGTIPQALFLMNSPIITQAIRSSGDTMLARLLGSYKDDRLVFDELYLKAHSRRPTAGEWEIFSKYRKSVPDRGEVFEDLLWSLVNSTEFISER